MATRRQAITLGVAGAPLALAGVAACGPNTSTSNDDPNAGNGGGSVRLAWWGNDERQQITSSVVEAYSEVEPEIDVSEEPSDWSGYWDKLATQSAGGDMPDVIQMSEAYLAEYGERGTLLDLSGAGLDTSGFSEGTVEVGELPDLGLLAINAGVNTVAVMLNPEIFDMAGVPLPDDTQWTWEELAETASEISENTPDGVYGVSQLAFEQPAFQLWARQRGQDLFVQGDVGFDASAAGDFYAYALRLQESGASAGASQTVEDGGLAIDQQLFSTGSTGIIFTWSNSVVPRDQAIGGHGVVVRPPSMTGNAEDAELWYRASMYWSVSASATDPEAAVQFVDYLVNNVEAAKILGSERGIPANIDCREAIEGMLSEAEKKVVDYLGDVEPELGAPADVYAMGGGNVSELITRHGADVLFNNATAEEAGQRLVDELEAAVS